MLKKFASVVAAMALVLAMGVTAFAADSKQQADPNQGKSTTTSPATGEESTAPIFAVVASVMAGAAVVVGTKKKTA